MNNSQFSILNSQLDYAALSALDKSCVGSDGWSPEDFRSEAEKQGGIVLAAYDSPPLTRARSSPWQLLPGTAGRAWQGLCWRSSSDLSPTMWRPSPLR